MANLQVENVPEALVRKVRRLAARDGRTIRDFVLEAVRAQVARDEFQSQLAGRRPVDLGRPAAAALDDVRRERDRELGT